MIRFVKYQNNSKGLPQSGKWYLRAVVDETIDIDALAEHMANHNTPFSKGSIKGILTDAVSCIKELMLEGKAVKLEDLAILKIGIQSKGADSQEDATAANVVALRFNALGTGEMKMSDVKNEVELKELTHYDPTTSTSTDDTSTDDTTSDSSGDTSGDTSDTGSGEV